MYDCPRKEIEHQQQRNFYRVHGRCCRSFRTVWHRDFCSQFNTRVRTLEFSCGDDENTRNSCSLVSSSWCCVLVLFSVYLLRSAARPHSKKKPTLFFSKRFLLFRGIVHVLLQVLMVMVPFLGDSCSCPYRYYVVSISGVILFFLHCAE